MLARTATISALAGLLALTLAGSEHHGVVKFGGLPVPGATVTASTGEKKFVAVTDEQGAYSFADLADGVWTLRVEMLCFAPLQRDVAVAPGAPGPEWELKLLPLAEMNALTAPSGPPAPQIDSQAASPKRGKKAVPPPAPANTPTAFQRTDVNASDDAAKISADNDATASDNLKQSAVDGFLINGSVNNAAASPFAQMPAFGNNRKGPRSLYTGGIGFILDNSAWDARPYSLTGQNTPRPAYNRITGMASFGGPLRIGRLFRVNTEPNVFINYQWTRNRNASTQSALMPALDLRGGDFSGTGQTVLDPTNGQPFPDSVIPRSRISPQARALLGLYPLPNFAGNARYNYQVPIAGATHQDSLQSRFNKMLNRRNQVNGLFAYQSTRSDSPNLFGFLDTSGLAGINGNFNWRHVFSTHMSGSLGYQYSRLSSRTSPFFANRENISAEAGIAGNNQDAQNWGPPTLVFASGIASLSDAQASLTRNQTSALTASMFWAHGAHNVTFGGDYRRQQFNHLSQQDPRGAFTFTGAATEASAGGVAVPGTGSDFADFLLGIPDTSSIAYGNADKYFRASSYDAFFNDDWRINPVLTVNAGVRWEYGSPITELYGRLVNLDIAPGYAAVAPVVAANPTGPLTGRRYADSLVNPDKYAFQPRIGIAWHPVLGSSLVVRAGYGLYYNTSVYQQIALQMAQQSPLSKSLSVENGPGGPLTLANGFLASAGITPNTFAIDPNFRVGYAHNWNLSVQSDLPAGMVLTATYLGVKGTRGVQQFLPNTYPLGAAHPCLTCPSGYAYMTSNGNSTRESGQVQLRRRLHAGFTASLQYTFSKAIDDAALGGRNQGGSVIAQNWLDLGAERGLSNFDQRHLLNLQLQHTTGMGLRGGTLMGGWKGALSKDWTFATSITAGSGTPLTPVYLAAVRGTGVTGSIRPEYTGAPLYAAPPGFFLNPAAYTAPPSGQWGNAGRNTIAGPPQFALNVSMARTFRLGERLNADLRLDSNNALNHVTYSSWITTVTSAQFGLPAAPNPMRTAQATFRVRF